MRDFVFGFYGEGIREYGFLLPLLVRVLKVMLPQSEVIPYEVFIEESGIEQPEKILNAAKEANKCEVLIFHLDADSRTTQKARQDRFQPGYELVQRQPKEDFNHAIVPVIPVHMTDAWMLIDFEAFKRVTKTKLTAKALKFPEKPQQIESVSDPKATFENAVRLSRPARRRISPGEVYPRLAEVMQLELLEQVPAYLEFKTQLTDFLKEKHHL